MILEEGFFPLPIPVPPMLETALGYPGRVALPGETLPRFVAFFWMQAGDEAAFDDGRCSGAGALNNESYLAFVGHRAVASHLTHYNLGASDAEATHWLVLDRLEPQTLYVVPVDIAERFLVLQWGEPQDETVPLVVESMEALEQLVADALHLESWSLVIVATRNSDVMQALEKAWQQTQELSSWLDAHVS